MLAEAPADEGQKRLDVGHERDGGRYCGYFVRFLMCASDLERSLGGGGRSQQQAECRRKS